MSAEPAPVKRYRVRLHGKLSITLTEREIDAALAGEWFEEEDTGLRHRINQEQWIVAEELPVRDD